MKLPADLAAKIIALADANPGQPIDAGQLRAAPSGSVEAAPGRWVMTIIGWHPVSDNKLIGKHFGIVSKLKRADKARIASECIAVPKASGPRRIDVRILTRYRGDSNNYRKSLLDALVGNGLLVDDSDKWCRAEFAIERGSKATVITLEDMGAMAKVVHCKKENYDVYIGRPSKWGNPFVIGKDGDRREVIAKYESWLLSNPSLLASLGELKGKTLGCWCSPQACHGDVLIRMANAEVLE